MPEEIEKEIEAIKTLLIALEPLNPKVRESVLGYVIKRLNISIPEVPTSLHLPEHKAPENGITMPDISGPKTSEKPIGQQIDIRQLKEDKSPKSAIEMAVLVSYYLSNVATENVRKETISTGDLEKYFKMAKFRLPKSLKFTLPNAKKAGYLESAGTGEYKLNPVGYNLVVHSMPKK